jgi:hypothetical protein
MSCVFRKTLNKRTFLLITGKVLKLSEPAEEVATFYAKMLEHDYTTKEVFNKNFLKDWRKVTISNVLLGWQTWPQCHKTFEHSQENSQLPISESENGRVENVLRMYIQLLQSDNVTKV